MNERQHQLEHNLVADGLANAYKKIEPYSKLILAGIVAIVVGLIAIGLYTSGQTAKRSDATLQLLMDNPEVAQQYPGTVAAAWSLLYQGNDNLARGISALYTDRDEAETLLAEAKTQFIDARGASNDTILDSRANFGLGMASESLGEIDEAIEAYKRTIDANESEQMVEVAQERIDRLSDPSTKDFIAWFSEQDFSPADPSLPPELPGASSLPELPDLDLPELDLGDEMSSSESGEAEDTPAKSLEGGLELPADESPAEDAPEQPKADGASSDAGADSPAAEPTSDAATDPAPAPEATGTTESGDSDESPAAESEPSDAPADSDSDDSQ
ncbi:tetratricopeptide repeat protein [Roseiconus nitratireducens]|uniref:Tetratricopeptide repeat protein n=1 Tax=Roseiconus nitratireducens TaxID=2605748 RepID=A0A5M6CZQ5_9BACT|nr:tetratricopeptide repeat protein [Roseiconus nitratireducens]KAA5539900.1 tetratricopeptide repeat protein [Roseiconus nitratireducens]